MRDFVLTFQIQVVILALAFCDWQKERWPSVKVIYYFGVASLGKGTPSMWSSLNLYL